MKRDPFEISLRLSVSAVKLLRRKRSAAAAVLLGVGILEHKARLHQRFLVIERHAVEIKQALGIDDDLHAVKFEYLVGRTLFGIKPELVAQARAAAAKHAETQHSLDTLLGESLPDLVDRLRRDLDHWLRLCRTGRRQRDDLVYLRHQARASTGFRSV